MMKKLFAAAAVTVCALAAAVSVSAKEALYSDIDTYINHYPISAYAVDGKMAVVAEDLRDYGFSVEWDANARALHILRDPNVTQLYRKDVYKPSAPSGTKMSDIYDTDITVDYNGIPLESYALNGYTLIPVNDLAELAGRGEWNGDIRAYKVWIDGLSQCDYAPLTQRCRNLYYATSYGYNPTMDFWEDMDSDGESERVQFYSGGEGKYGEISATLTIDGAATGDFLKGCVGYNIEAVYLMDMMPNDHAKEIAVFTMCESADPMLKIFRYSNGGVKALNFDLWDKWFGTRIQPDFWLGYADDFPLTVNDDGSITLQTQTDSNGMWDVYTTYRINEYGNIVLVPQDTYTVVPSSWYHSDQWGYWLVEQTFTGSGLPLYQGDRIKPVLDDGNNHIYIQKSNGQGGWFTIPEYSLSYGNVSKMFIMAG